MRPYIYFFLFLSLPASFVYGGRYLLTIGVPFGVLFIVFGMIAFAFAWHCAKQVTEK